MLTTVDGEHGARLVMDEVTTSRPVVGGAQPAHGVDADLTVPGKYVGSGLSRGPSGPSARPGR